MLLATLLLVQAQPYFYEDSMDTDLMDDYQVVDACSGAACARLDATFDNTRPDAPT